MIPITSLRKLTLNNVFRILDLLHEIYFVIIGENRLNKIIVNKKLYYCIVYFCRYSLQFEKLVTGWVNVNSETRMRGLSRMQAGLIAGFTCILRLRRQNRVGKNTRFRSYEYFAAKRADPLKAQINITTRGINPIVCKCNATFTHASIENVYPIVKPSVNE